MCPWAQLCSCPLPAPMVLKDGSKTKEKYLFWYIEVLYSELHFGPIDSCSANLRQELCSELAAHRKGNLFIIYCFILLLFVNKAGYVHVHQVGSL